MVPTLEAQLSQSMQEVESLQRQLEALQNGQSEVIATATEQLRLELHSLEVQAQQAQSASREAEAVIEELQGRVESLNECNSDLQRQCERLERQSQEREENFRHTMEFQQLRMLDETNRRWEAREERLLHQLRTLEAKQQATPSLVSRTSEHPESCASLQLHKGDDHKGGLSVSKSEPRRGDESMKSVTPAEIHMGGELHVHKGGLRSVSSVPSPVIKKDGSEEPLSSAKAHETDTNPPNKWMAKMMLAQQLPPIPKFTGEEITKGETFRDWKEQFEMVAELGGWDAHTKLVNLTTRLKGQAYAFYRSCTIVQRTSYQALTAELEKRFTPVQITAVQSSLFHDRRQKPKESVDEYAQDLRRLFFEAYPRVQQEASEMGKAVLANQFVNGLIQELKLKLAGREGSFDELLARARFEEVKIREISGIRPHPTPPDKGRERNRWQQNKPYTKSDVHVRPTSSDKYPQSKNSPDSSHNTQRRKDENNCYYCKRPGHLKRNCPLLTAHGQEEAKGPLKAKAQTTAAITESKNVSISPGQKEIEDALNAVSSTLYVVSTDKGQSAVLGPKLETQMCIERTPVSALVDTGSPATIVSLNFLMQVLAKQKRKEQSVDEWKIGVKKRITPSTVTLRSYGGPELNLVGQISLTLTRGEYEFEAVVQIQKEAPIDLLVGTDVLPHLGFAVIERSQGVARNLFKSETPTVLGSDLSDLETAAPLVTPCEIVHHDQSNEKALRGEVHLLQAVRIPARHQKVVKARVSPFHIVDDIIFEPHSEFRDCQSISVAESLVKPDTSGCFSVILSNATHVTTRLEKESIIGHVSPADLAVDKCDDIKPKELGEIALTQADTELEVTPSQRLQQLLQQTGLDPKFASKPPTLSKAQASQLRELLIEYQYLFALDSSELGCTDLVTHSIDTGNKSPVRQPVRRIPFALRDTVHQMIQDMLEQGVVQPSHSPWASPIVLVKKKDGSIRFCVDYRRLNSITKVDVFPLPRIDDTLDLLAGAKYFTSLDLASGYWQVEMSPESREKTAFITYSGLYEFTKMPFGLCNAPATFQRLMETVLAGLNRKSCVVYIDDILVFSRTYEEHLAHLREVFERLAKAGLRMKPKKCNFCCEQVCYLGHVVSEAGIAVNPEKVEAVRSFPQPTNLKKLRSFLGLASYYRRFIPNFSKVAGPLYALTKKNAELSWTPKCKEVFENLKELLTTTPVLAFPEFSHSFILETDASGDGLGAVLAQKVDGVVRPLAYASRTLQAHEKNLGITELEALAVVWAAKHFRPYLYAHHCDVFTDHIALKSLLNTPQPSGKLARWGLVLQDLDLNIQYRSGRSNTNADVLSRYPVSTAALSEADQPTAVVATTELVPNSIQEYQYQDPALRKIIEYLKEGELPDSTKEARELVLSKQLFELVDDVLYRIEKDKTLRVVLPESCRKQLFDQVHGGVYGGHLRDAKIHSVLSRHYWWKGMRGDIIKWCRACVTCASRRVGKAIQPPLTPIPVFGPFDRVGVDVIQFPKSVQGNQYAVVFVDYLTKWPEVFAVPDQTSLTIAKLLVEQIVSRHGVPKELLSDRGKNFLSELMQEVYDLLGTHKVSTTAYHPQTDGLVERFNRTLTDMLAKTVEKQGRDWDEHLPYVLFAYRMCAQQSTKESPFFLLYGRDPQLPTDEALSTPKTRYQVDLDDYKTDLMSGLTDAWELAREQLKKSQKSQKRFHDRKSTEVKVEVGDRVFLHMPAATKGSAHKFSRPFHGPYRVLEVTTNDAKICPVHSPNSEPIYVSLNRIRHCPDEISEDEFWPPRKKKTQKKLSEDGTTQNPSLWTGRLRPRT